MNRRIPTAMREAVLNRDGYFCIRCGRSIMGGYYSLHHRRRKGMGGSRLLDTMANLITLCGSGTTKCHGFVHTEASWDDSYGLGWMVPNGVTPEEWPVWCFDEQWRQPGLELTPSEPHERQKKAAA